jgi:hypothetical protein
VNVRLAAAALMMSAVVSTEARGQAVVPSPAPRTEPTRLARVVADQVLSGRPSQCGRDTQVFYESCLLYQGAFGTWRSVGFPDRCGEEPLVKVKDASLSFLADKALHAADNACFSSIYAVAVANTVPILASTLNQYFPMMQSGGFENPADGERCLQLRYGICGNHAALAQNMLEEAGLVVRAVQFFYTVNGTRYSHIAPEVLIAGKYRFIDTTYGGFWTTTGRRADNFDLASLEEVRARKHPARSVIWNAALMPYAIRRAVTEFNPFDYLTAHNVNVIRDDKGTINLTFRDRSGIENFADLPRFVGDNRNDGQTVGLDFAIDGARGRYQVTLRTRATAVTNFAAAAVCIDDVCQAAPANAAELTFEVKDPRRMHIQSEADAAYVIMESLSWKRLN